jgi:hypothetical protein
MGVSGQSHSPGLLGTAILYSRQINWKKVSTKFAFVVILYYMEPQFKSGIGLLFRGSLILFRHTVGLLLASDQPAAKASTYTGQHNTETQRHTSMPGVEFEPTISLTKRPRPTP